MAHQKFTTLKEAFEFFLSINFSPWDSHRLSFALYRNEWGVGRVKKEVEAAKKLRERFPGLASAVVRHEGSEQEAFQKDFEDEREGAFR